MDRTSFLEDKAWLGYRDRRPTLYFHVRVGLRLFLPGDDGRRRIRLHYPSRAWEKPRIFAGRRYASPAGRRAGHTPRKGSTEGRVSCISPELPARLLRLERLSPESRSPASSCASLFSGSTVLHSPLRTSYRPQPLARRESLKSDSRHGTCK